MFKLTFIACTWMWITLPIASYLSMLCRWIIPDGHPPWAPLTGVVCGVRAGVTIPNSIELQPLTAKLATLVKGVLCTCCKENIHY